MDTEKLTTILIQRFSQIKKKSPSYSLRAFAKKMGMSPGSLSEIMKGKRKITASAADKLALKLELSPLEKRILGITSASAGIQFDEGVPLDSDAVAIISDWRYFAILNLLLIPESPKDANSISKRLGLNKAMVEDSLSRLKRMKLIEKSGVNWKRTSSPIVFSGSEAAAAIKNSILNDADLIKDALRLPPEIRSSTAATFTIDPEKISTLRALLHHFLEKEFLVEAKKTKAKEVYRISIHLFPLTK